LLVDRVRHAWIVGGLTLLGLALRMFFFTGFAFGDDIFYGLQAAEHALNGAWPPQPYHWQTRLGVTMPTTLSLMMFGREPLAYVLWPLVVSVAAIPACYLMARVFVADRIALLAAAFQACFPIELIYATQLYPDVPVGLFSAISIWFWIRALRSDAVADYVWAGTAFSAAYLCRETIVLSGPVYIALWLLAGRWSRPRMVAVALVPIATLVSESLLFFFTAGSAAYRVDAVQAQIDDPLTRGMVLASQAGGGYLTDPLLMLISSHEFGLYHLAVALTAPLLWVRQPAVRPLIVWWVSGYLWFYYGTTTPTEYVPLQRDPRYGAFLTLPGVTLVACALWMFRPLVRWTALAVLLLVGIAGAGLDAGASAASAHAALSRSPYAREAAVDAADYYGARWMLGFDRKPTFRLVDDLGRRSVVESLRRFDGTVTAHHADVRYVVFSPLRRPDLTGTLNREGWRQVAAISGEGTPGRRLVGRALALVPGQASRAERLVRPPGLLVFENPKRQAVTEG
jgi:hypothetical protein